MQKSGTFSSLPVDRHTEGARPIFRSVAVTRWWRTFPPSILLCGPHLPAISRVLAASGVAPPPASLRDEAACAIAGALSSLRAGETGLPLDRAMTALLRAALRGSAAAVDVLVHALRRLAAEDPYAGRLGAAWADSLASRSGR